MVIVPTVIARSVRMGIVPTVIARSALMATVPRVTVRSARMVIVPIVGIDRTVATAVLLPLVRRPADVAVDTVTTVAVVTVKTAVVVIVTTVALAQGVWIVRRVQQAPRFQMT